ncbi:MAG: hypothetical protein HY649_09110 [Acidobacteria bacterium]|nr:hypothetical protein [Acidobacteriota bacterium]
MKILILFLFVSVVVLPARSQEPGVGIPVGGGINLPASARSKPTPRGTAPPANCTVGELFYDTDATAGQNLYGCTATDTWTLLGDGGGAGGGDNISVNGSAATDADLDDATPVAPANSINVKWQKDALSPNNVSANVPYAAPITATGGNLTLNQNAGTDVTADLEEETHASEHQNGGNDEVATATPGANAIPKAEAGGTLADGWLPAGITRDSEINVQGTTNEITSSGNGPAPVLSLSSTMDLGGKAVEIPNSTTVPGTCAVGQIYHDSDAPVGSRFYLCTTTDTWTAIDNPFGTAVDGGTGGEIADGTITAADLAANQNISTIGITIDGGGSAITSGVQGYIEVPFACTITQATTLADQSGSIVIDVWKDTYANYPPTVLDTITASAKPTITTATKAQDATLTGWTTSVSAGDIIGFNVDSATTVTRVHLTLKCVRT